MRSDLKFWSCKPVYLRNTAAELEHLVTVVALKMMMMGFPGPFVNYSAAGQFNGREPSHFQQCFDVAVNSGNSKSTYLGLRQLEYLLR
ncbi:MAG TPA: hypothetical protein VLJ11_19055 [Bryobacteraceae bacterium]|nr:hypothetical protein [Bryobacteraceae bacterium]